MVPRLRLAQAVMVVVGLQSLAALIGPPATLAQTETPTTAGAVATAIAPAGITPSVDPAAVAAIARELNCPLCQGYSLLDCPLQVCGQMRQLIADRLAEGWTPDAVRAQFVADYGPQILSAPPASGWGLAAWLAPLVAALAGVGVLWLRRRSGGALPAVTVSRAAPAADPTPDPSGTPDAAGMPDAAMAAYRRRLEAMAREEA